jgi:hypothetical protein
VITRFPQRVDQNHPIPNQTNLIKRGSYIACNHKLGYLDSCTLCKSSVMYPRVVISSLSRRLEKPPFCHSCTSFSVWPKDHYMSLQRSTIRYVILCYGIPNKLSPLPVLRFPAQTTPLAPCGLVRSQSMMKDRSQSMMSSPLNRA